MIRIATALLLISTAAMAETDDQTKTNALKIGYALNGNSMVRWGTIDLTSVGQSAPIPTIVSTTAIAPDKLKNEEEVKPTKRHSRRYHRRHRR